jgi:hypothetical protein
MKALKFDYINWKGEAHTYVIVPTGADIGPKKSHGEFRPMLHGNVLTRDGDDRPEMGPTRRRSFVLAELKNIKEVEV